MPDDKRKKRLNDSEFKVDSRVNFYLNTEKYT